MNDHNEIVPGALWSLQDTTPTIHKSQPKAAYSHKNKKCGAASAACRPVSRTILHVCNNGQPHKIVAGTTQEKNNTQNKYIMSLVHKACHAAVATNICLNTLPCDACLEATRLAVVPGLMGRGDNKIKMIMHTYTEGAWNG